jgi:ABC-type transport system involved in multi-copper enzyme maturation permease subunit
MNKIMSVIWVEGLKIRRSRMFWGSVIFFIFVSFMMGLLMFVQKYPEISAKLGMIGNKATMLRFGDPEWKNFLRLLNEGFGGIGIMGIGFLTTWVFGREYSDNTLKDLLVLPVSRNLMVLAKFEVVTIWYILLSVLYLGSGILVGLIIDLPGLSENLLFQNIKVFGITSILILFLCTPVALISCYGRGYLLSMGFVIITVIIANFSGLVGLGPYFPWSVPGLYGSQLNSPEMRLNTASYVILILTGLSGLIGTVAYWQYADHK